jgi:hypothetical protein
MYCTKCGAKNEDDAVFCNKCGNNLQGSTSGPGPVMAPHTPGKSRQEEECERDCQGGSRENAAWWAIIVIIVGAWILWEFGLKHVLDTPKWMNDDIFCTAIWIMVGIAVIAAGLRMMMRKGRQT